MKLGQHTNNQISLHVLSLHAIVIFEYCTAFVIYNMFSLNGSYVDLIKFRNLN